MLEWKSRRTRTGSLEGESIPLRPLVAEPVPLRRLGASTPRRGPKVRARAVVSDDSGAVGDSRTSSTRTGLDSQPPSTVDRSQVQVLARRKVVVAPRPRDLCTAPDCRQFRRACRPCRHSEDRSVVRDVLDYRAENRSSSWIAARFGHLQGESPGAASSTR